MGSCTMESSIAPNANMTVAATAAYRLTRGGAVEVHSLVQRVDQLVVTPRLSADVSSAVAGSPDIVEMILAQMSLEEMLRLASTSRVWAAATKLLVDRVLRVWESKEYWRNATVVGFKKKPTRCCSTRSGATPSSSSCACSWATSLRTPAGWCRTRSARASSSSSEPRPSDARSPTP